MRRAHIYKEFGAHGSWWTYDVFETEGPIRARFIVTGTRKRWSAALEAALLWLKVVELPVGDGEVDICPGSRTVDTTVPRTGRPGTRTGGREHATDQDREA